MSEPDRTERLADQLIAAVPRFGPREQRIALALVRMLAGGKPVSHQRLSAALGTTEAATREIVGSWPGVFRGEDERIVGFMGLSVIRFGEHRIELDGRALSAWCAWDTLFLPALLGSTARVRSRCPATAAEISLTVSPVAPSDIRPRAAVLSFLAPERPFDSDVIRSFCHFVHFFASEQASAAWTARNPDTFTLSIEQGFRLGELTNEIIFGNALRDAAAAAPARPNSGSAPAGDDR
jgi:alkylmercury lyase